MVTSFASDVLIVALVAEALAEGLVDSEPLEGARHWVGKWHPMLAIFTVCGKCVSFWTALPVALLLNDGWVAVATWLVGWRLAHLWHEGLGLVESVRERWRPEWAALEKVRDRQES